MSGVVEAAEYVSGAVRYLENFFGLRLTPDQVRTWLAEMERYPRWKLGKLDHYRGGKALIDVCRWLDDLQPEPERAHEALGYNTAQIEQKRSPGLARECTAYVAELMSDTLSRPEKDELERDFVESMQKRYPHAAWRMVRKGNRKVKTPDGMAAGE